MEPTSFTDSSVLESIYNRFFTAGNVFLKFGTLNIKIKYLEYKNGMIYLKIKEGQHKLDTAILYIRHGDEVIFSHIRFNSKKDDYHLFELENIQILKMHRKEERKQFDSSQDDTGAEIFLSSIISDFVIRESLGEERRHLKNIKEDILFKFENLYAKTKVFFMNEKKSDNRMKFFISNRKPIYVKDIFEPSEKKDKGDRVYYIDTLYNPDYALVRDNIVSEISAPFLYKGMIPFGYLQVNDQKPLSEKAYSKIRKFCLSVSELMSRDDSIIKASEDRINVTDFSEGGMGIVFKERVLIKHFKVDSYIHFILYLPNNQHASVLCIVRNINLMDKSFYKVGCEIINIDAIGEVAYFEFLDSL
ncbi:MAG: hypothetical protein GY754_32910 [bacterium]|nr:hypothetical protein [bacterium]